MTIYDGIGVLDSGLGGLTVASEIMRILPGEKIYYFGDTAHVPYGDKTEAQINGYVGDIVEFLSRLGIKAVVMACNTSSAVVLPNIKDKYKFPMLGVIEFAAKTAVKSTKNGKVGVVANPVTVRSGAYVKTVLNISDKNITVGQSACPRWVPLIESGIISGPEVEKIVAEDLKPLLDEDIDTLILGCTHYPYLIPVIRKVAGYSLKIINPAESTALKLKEILLNAGLLADKIMPGHKFFSSGDSAHFRENASFFLGRDIDEVRQVNFELEPV